MATRLPLTPLDPLADPNAGLAAMRGDGGGNSVGVIDPIDASPFNNPEYIQPPQNFDKYTVPAGGTLTIPPTATPTSPGQIASEGGSLGYMIPNPDGTWTSSTSVGGPTSRAPLPLGTDFLSNPTTMPAKGTMPPLSYWTAEGGVQPFDNTPQLQTANATPAAPARLSFGVGFDPEKLNDPTYVSSKYTPALRYFAGIKDTLPPTTASLNQIAADAQAHGFPNARVTSADMIDFGDGNGPIDVITDVGGAGAGWAFQNTTGNAQWEAAHPQPTATGAPAPPPTTMGPAGAAPGPGLKPGEVNPLAPGGGGGGGGGGGEIPPWLAPFLPGPTPTGPEFPTGFAPPGDAGTFVGDYVQQVGQDPDSQLISAALAGLMQNGGTPYGANVGATLSDIIGGGGANLPSAGVSPMLRDLIQRFAKPTDPNAVVASGGTSLPTNDILSQLRAMSGKLAAGGSGSAFDPVVASGGASLPMERIMSSLDAILQGVDTTDPAARRNRLVAARDANATAFKGQLADARGALAERGGLSQPGVNQGTENTAIGRTAEALAPTYANSIRDIETAAMDRESANRMTALGLKQSALGTETAGELTGRAGQDTAAQNQIVNTLQSLVASGSLAQSQSDALLKAMGLDESARQANNANLTTTAGLTAENARAGNDAIMQSLSLATGLSQSQAQNVLQAAGAGTARQTALSNIALQTLSQNADWSKFLAEYGLNHDAVMEQLQQGRINALVPLLQLFLSSASLSTGGYI